MKSTNESVTDYLIRTETACASLKNAGEAINDSLLIAMIFKGLPSHFKPFTTVVTQKEQQQPMTFTEFKIALRNYEDIDKIQSQSKPSSSIMASKHAFNKPTTASSTSTTTRPKFNKWCNNSKMSNHNSDECRRMPSYNAQSKRKETWCEICRSNTHDTKYCRKLAKLCQIKTNDDDDKNYEHFVFGLGDKSSRD
ncbi:CCHC-type zinc finger, nucleic acid binding protein a [Elysia marginata]|uniref:CCHC-type zinc finger, nucleic acid binding protein a n=1 Tax=Elysia marginata TaxID=1093978 RepID=A0AAV4ITS7_9GAST|nr:CCHC-type zinc finger, nucleic acid binding protein a [Elysia marginata]